MATKKISEFLPGVTVKDEGSNLTTTPVSIDFVGAGVTATNTGDAVTVTVPLPPAPALDDLTDVTITTPANGQVLKYNGSAWVNAAGSAGGGFYYQATAPGSPEVGDRWVNSTTGVEYTYINDGNTSQWVELISVGGNPSSSSGGAGANIGLVLMLQSPNTLFF